MMPPQRSCLERSAAPSCRAGCQRRWAGAQHSAQPEKLCTLALLHSASDLRRSQSAVQMQHSLFRKLLLASQPEEKQLELL